MPNEKNVDISLCHGMCRQMELRNSFVNGNNLRYYMSEQTVKIGDD